VVGADGKRYPSLGPDAPARHGHRGK